LPEGVASARLANYAQRRSVINREAVRSTLQSDDYSRLLLEFTAAVLALPECEAACLEARARALLDTCAAESGRLAAQLLAGDDAAADRLRAAYKRLRYALEFFAPLLADQCRREGRVAANGLPELLARLNELARAVHLTEEALPGEPGEAIRDGLELRRKALLAELRAGPST
ncbi:CHAD domain-containing protein, partial [Accumulibacter sp.]|uniref:CHAD domain-containing protein n=1 Tax=Accumulibacter sp. TaxID=2053492 RepID=UPI0035B3BA18